MRKEVELKMASAFQFDQWNLQGNQLFLKWNGQDYRFEIQKKNSSDWCLFLPEKNQRFRLAFAGDEVVVEGFSFQQLQKDRRGGKSGNTGGELVSPMPGKILKIFVSVNDEVKPEIPSS